MFISCYTAERDCLSFHEGVFKFETIVNNKLESSRFIRNDSIEIEYYKGEVDSATIRWVNDCECILTKINPEKYFLEIARVDTEEIIAASFLNGGKNTFENLPLGYPLSLNIIHDINANQELDSQDKVLPPIPVSIHLFEQKLSLPINLENL